MLLTVIFCIFWGFLGPVALTEVTDAVPVTNISTTPAPKTVKDIEKDLEALFSSLSKKALPHLMRNSDINISAICKSTLRKMFLDIRRLKLPVFKLLDAMAKPQYGMLRGSLSLMGDYDGCLDVTANENGYVAQTSEEEFYHGQYCLIEGDLPKTIMTALKDYKNGRVNSSVFGKLEPLIHEFSGSLNFVDSHLKYRIGICMPSTCSEEDLQMILRRVPIRFITMHLKHCEDGLAKRLNMHQAVFIFLVILFGAMVIFGTFLEVWFYIKCSNFHGYHKDRFVQFLLSFSVYANTKKLLHGEKKSDGSEIPVINGIYVCGILAVILYHTYFTPYVTYIASHSANMGEHLKDFQSTLVVVMAIFVETFFVISGLFLVYPQFRKEEGKTGISIIKIVIRRYIRLYPSLVVILGIIIVLPLVGSGPMWAEIIDIAADNTRKRWWAYVLMFNNFLPINSQNFQYLWFIPCLMQITIIGAILLWIISKFTKIGIALTIIIGLTCNITLGLLTALRNYPPTYALYYYYDREKFETVIFTSPLSHIFSFEIGMLLGLYMAQNPSLKWSKKHVVLGWIVALFMTLGNPLLAYLGHKGLEPNPLLAAFYAASHRTVFCIGLAWIILACTHGYGGFLGKILSWKGFCILSKLGYSAYLFHFIIIAFHISSTRVTLMFSHNDVFLRFCGYSVVTFMVAFLLYITFEVPLMFVESLFLSTTSSKNNIKNNEGSKHVDILPTTCNEVFTSSMLNQIWDDKIEPFPDDEEHPEPSKL